MKNPQTKKEAGITALIIALCLFVMLPRLLSAQFGLLDDAVLLRMGEQTVRDPASVLYLFKGSGRFLPTALFLRGIVFFFARFSPFLWYLWMVFFLIITCLLLAYIAKRSSSFRSLAMVSSVIFLLASPAMIENFYTLSKSEVSLILFLGCAVLLAGAFRVSSPRTSRVLLAALCFLFLLLTFGTKETAIVLPILFLSWLALSWYAHRKTGEFRNFLYGDLILFAGSLIGAVLYFVIRSRLGISSITPGTYSAGYDLLNIKKLWDNLQILAGWLIRDYPYLIPLSLALFLFKPLRQSKTMFFGLRYILWMGAWAGVLLPWGYLSYYLLPFTFGSALFSGTILADMFCMIRTNQTSGSLASSTTRKKLLMQRLGIGIFVFFTALSFIPPLMNARAYAVEQLTYDKANWQLVEKAAQLPANSRLLINLPPQMEYFNEIRLHLGVLNRPDLTVEPYTQGFSPVPGQEIYLASLSINKHFLPQLRSINQTDVAVWGRCLDEMPNLTEKIFSSTEKHRIIDIGLHRLFTFFIEPSDMIGQSDRGVLLDIVFEYGWNLWKYDPVVINAPRPAVYQNGVFTYQAENGMFRQVSLEEDGFPLSGDINGDRFTDLVLFDQKRSTFLVDLDLDGKIDERLPFPAVQDQDIPLVGDWDGDGKDTPGYYRPSNASWHFYNSFSANDPLMYQFGGSSDIPIIGDWNLDGKDEPGYYNPDSGFTFLVNDLSNFDMSTALNGLPGSIPVVMPREGLGHDPVAYVQGSTWNTSYFPVGCMHSNPPKPLQVEYNGIPLAGIWKVDGMK